MPTTESGKNKKSGREKKHDWEAINEKLKAATPDGRKIIVTGLVVIGVFFGGLGVWAAFFPFSGAVIAPGTIKVSMNNKIVQHLEGGIVDKILVKEGDIVHKGDVLLTLKSERVNASVEMLKEQLWGQLALKARLEAQAHMKDTINWPEELLKNKHKVKVSEILASETDVFRSSLQNLEGKIRLSKAQIKQLLKAIQGYEAELKAKEHIVSSLAEELQAKEELYKHKYLDKVAILELRRRLAEAKGDQGQIVHQIAELKKKIDEIRLQIIDLKNSYVENATKKLNQVMQDIVATREKLRPLLDAQARLIIKAPISGKVFNIQVHTEEGSVLKPGQPVLEIVPMGASLIAEAYVRPKDIAHICIGQDVRVNLLAFNRRVVPPVHGNVTYISPDIIRHQGNSKKQEFFKIHVNIDESEVKKYGAYLVPGMPVVCYVMTEKRTILTYLLEPLLEMVDSSLREPD